MGGCFTHQEDPNAKNIKSTPANKITHRSSADYGKSNQTMTLINKILEVVSDKLKLKSTPEV